jgi:hypothetical protein
MVRKPFMTLVALALTAQAPSGFEANADVPSEYREVQAIAVRGGVVFIAETPTNPTSAIGVAYVLPRIFYPKWEIGADAVARSGGLIHLARKFMWFERTSYRPFLLLGPTLKLNPNQRLATLVDLNNYQLRLSLGFEDALNSRRSARFEVQLLAGAKEQTLSLLFGHSWAF